jgi:transcriptional regulator with XRE-family HTH domain
VRLWAIFLRERRESIAPERVGISSRRGRRTPGLRREEVAFLADIGVKWYARLEAGDDIRPSAATLTGIAVALQLSDAELEYLLELAGLRQPAMFAAEIDTTIPAPLSALLGTLHGVAATVGDRILTPLRWNAIADGLYGHSRFELALDRNGLVRSLVDPDFVAFLGSEREEIVFRAVGMFRLNFSSPRPSPISAAVYERIKDNPLFQRAWSRRVVAHELSSEKVTIRNHAAVGRLAMYAVDFSTQMRTDIFLRMLVPADEETAEKFERLERAGRAGPTLSELRPPEDN